MSAASATTFLPYTLTLRAPAIATALSGDPNSAATQPFIPGGAIRGAVAARLLALGEPEDGEVFRELVLSGAVRYLHAYPEVNGQRAMPASQAWRTEKADPSRAHDLAGFHGEVPESDEELTEVWPEEVLASLGAPFAAPSLTSGSRLLATPLVGARVHQQRDRVKGRPWLAHVDGQEVRRGAIFAREYLEAEQVFRGLVQVQVRATSTPEGGDAEAARERWVERIRAALDGQPLLVGRSRRAGYGGDAEIRIDATETDAEYTDVSGGLAGDLAPGERFRLLLVSAYLGRHPATGQFDPAALGHELGQRGLQAAVERRRWSFETVGSFNGKWRLEVPQATAAAGGSVLVLRSEQPIPLTLLRDIEREGLGERRVEGFGRVLFLHHDEQAKPFPIDRQARDHRSSRPAPANEAVDPASRQQITFVERRIVVSAAQRELDRVAADLAGRASKPPTTSLLGRIRTVFRPVRDEPTARHALDVLHTWCDDKDKNNVNAMKPAALEKLQACEIDHPSPDHKTLLKWLQGLAAPAPEGETSAWRRLVKMAGTPTTLRGLADRVHLTGPEATERILESHAAQLTVHLIDGVLAMLARKNRGADR